MHFELTEDQKMIQDMARDFAKKSIAEGVCERDENGFFVRSLFDSLAEQGLAGMLYPADEEEAFADFSAFNLALQEIARYDASLALVLVSHAGLCSGLIQRVGSPAHRDNYLTALNTGEMLGAWVFAGKAGEITAREQNGQWCIDGQANFIVSAENADLFVITAKLAQGIGAFFVKKDHPGLQVKKIEQPLSFRTAGLANVRLENVMVDNAAAVTDCRSMEQHVQELLLESQLALSSIQLGSCRFIFDASLQYSKERVQFDKPIAEHQAIRFKLADMSVESEAAELMIMRAAYLRDKTGMWEQEALLASQYMTTVADRIGHAGLQVHGGYGYMEEFHISRHYRDLVGLGMGFIAIEKIHDRICRQLIAS